MSPTEEAAAAQPTAGAPGEPAPGVPHPAYSRPATGKGASAGRIVKHRATQLVAVGLLGLVIGGGTVALADRDHHHPRYGVGFDRPGHPGHPRFEERIPERRSERGPERGGSEGGSERGPEWIPEREFER